MKLREYFFVHKENKNNDFIQQFLLFRVAFMRESRCMHVHCKQGPAYLGSMSERRLLRQQHHKYASWYSRERSSTDTEEKKFVNKVVIFVFFIYSRSFITLRLNH